MKILDVIAPDDKDGANTKGWNQILNQMSDERSSVIKEQQKKNGGKSPYYFLIVENSIELLESKFATENKIANEFVGKFWYRKYSPIIPAGDDKAPSVSIDAPDASAEFFAGGSGIPGHPICGFGHEPGSYVDKLIAETHDESKTEEATFEAEDVSGQVTKTYKVKANLVIAERDAKWYPHQSQVDYYSGTVDYLRNEFGLWLVGQDGRPDALIRLYPCAKENKNIRIYCVRTGRDEAEFPITKESIENFYETKKATQLKRTLLEQARDSKNPYEKKQILGASGLTSSQCLWITFDGFSFMMPVGGNFFKDKQKVNQSLKEKMQEEKEKFRKLVATPRKSLLDGGETLLGGTKPAGVELYKVRLRQTYDIPVHISKYQLPFVGEVKNVAMKHDYYFNELSQIEKELAAGKCSPDQKRIADAHKTAYSFLQYSNTKNLKSVNFTMYGIMPEKILIEQGLNNVTINIADDGPKTTYSLSSKYMTIPETNISNKIIESLSNRLTTTSIAGNLNSSYRPLTLPTN